jgi:hypothetical protein
MFLRHMMNIYDSFCGEGGIPEPVKTMPSLLFEIAGQFTINFIYDHYLPPVAIMFTLTPPPQPPSPATALDSAR